MKARRTRKRGQWFSTFLATVMIGVALSLLPARGHAGINRWTSIGPSLQPGSGSIKAIAVDPSSPATIYAGAYAEGVYKTTDGGATWTPVNNGISHPFVAALAIDPQAPTTLYAGMAWNYGLYKSIDGGASWQHTGLMYSDIYSIAIDPRNPTIVYAGTGRGMRKSIDGGINWSQPNGGFPNIIVRAVVIDPLDSSTVYAAAVDFANNFADNQGGVFKSTDWGETWALLWPMELNYWSLAVDPVTPTTLFAAASSGLVESTDGGQTWAYATDEVNFKSLAISPTNPTTVYAGYGGGVIASADGGATWKYANTGFPRPGSVLALAVDPSNPDIVYAGRGDGIFRMRLVRCQNDADCNDGNSCTTDLCDPSSPSSDISGCVHRQDCDPRALRRCQKAIARAGATFFGKKLKAIQKCRDAINKGKLSITPDACAAEGKTARMIAKAGVKARRLVERACTDTWLGGLTACASTVDGLVTPAGDAGCLITTHEAAVDSALAAEYGRVLAPEEKDAVRCQAAIGRAGYVYATKVQKALQKCRDNINKGRLDITPADCPIEDKTALAIAKAGQRARRTAERKCTDSLIASVGPCAATLDALIAPTGDGGCLLTTHSGVVDDMLAAEYGP